MPRTVEVVYVLEARLIARTALHVGGLGASAEADLTIARDGQGRPYVPGTSLAGVLRRLIDEDSAATLFGCLGDEEGRHGGKSNGATKDTGHASHAFVADAPIEGAKLELRDHVRIDRESGAAADTGRWSREVVGAGATVSVRMHVETDGKNEERVSDAVRRIAGRLRSTGLRAGGSTSRGLGRLRTAERDPDAVRLWRLVPGANDEHLKAYWDLRSGKGTPILESARQPHVEMVGKAGGPDWTFELHWHPRGPLFVKHGVRGFEIDQLPLLARRGDAWHAVLPGSGIKGAWAAHAERIERTLRNQDDTERPAIARALFGMARPSKRKEAAPASPPRAQASERVAGRLSVEDCFHRVPAPAELETMVPGDALDEWRGSHFRTCVAIDRWTGGALDSALFDMLEPPWEVDAGGDGGLWEPIRLDVDFGARGERMQEVGVSADAQMALVWLLLRDIVREGVPLGYGALRGLGACEVREVQATNEGESLPVLTRDSFSALPAAWLEHVRRWESALGAELDRRSP